MIRNLLVLINHITLFNCRVVSNIDLKVEVSKKINDTFQM